MPELLTPCWSDGKPYQPIYGVQADMETFNPSEPRVFSTMNALLREVKDRFPSNYIHLGKNKHCLSKIKFFLCSRNILGMDEVYDPCW
jgi:hypothetical protein